jgi:GT2 family glycosyltransferase
MSEEFFIAMEDVDFCLRARKKGWRVVYCGRAVAYHMEGKTRGTTPENKVRYWYLRELEGVAKFRKIWFDAGNTPLFETEV